MTVKIVKLSLHPQLYAELEALAVDQWTNPTSLATQIVRQYVIDSRTESTRGKPGPKPADKPKLSPAEEILSRRKRRPHADESDAQLRELYVQYQKAYKKDPRDVGAKFAAEGISKEMQLRAEEDAEAADLI